MVQALTTLLALSGLVTAVDPVRVYGELGADLLLPVAEACTHEGSYRFDLYGTQHIGAYDGELQERINYAGRLVYNKSTCTITLRGLRTEDGTRFTVRLFLNINDKSKAHDITYQVTFRDPPTSHPSTTATHPTQDARNGTQASNDGVQGFISFCLSLDSAVNAAVGLLLLILQRYFNKLDQGRMYVASLTNSIITVVSEICSIGTMYSGNYSTFFLCVIPIILIMDAVGSRGYLNYLKDFLITFFRNTFSCCKCCNDDLSPKSKSNALNVWIVVTLLLQVLFAVVVGILYHRIDNSLIGFLFLSFALSGVLRAGIFTIIYCYKRYDEVPTEDPNITSEDPRKETSL